MPGFDGTGPAGQGPMTGGGRGWCSPADQGFRSQGGFWPGRGRGFRRSFWGRGMAGWRGTPRYWGWEASSPTVSSREEQMNYLRDEANALRRELQAIENRLKDMESPADAS